MGLSAEEKDDFWDSFIIELSGFPKQESIFIGSDMNGHFGRDADRYGGVHGDMGFGTRNADGGRIIEFGGAVGMVVCNTFFYTNYLPVWRQWKYDYYLMVIDEGDLAECSKQKCARTKGPPRHKETWWWNGVVEKVVAKRKVCHKAWLKSKSAEDKHTFDVAKKEVYTAVLATQESKLQ